MLQKIKSKIVTLDEAVSQTNLWKETSSKVVFTNGCFDILHRGHVEYLALAKELGDKLIVGLNSDSSIKRLKGENRPVQDEISRSLIIASLECVDLVILFSDDTPQYLIQNLIPNVLVKGGDYTIENIVGADVVMNNGGEVKTIDFVDGYSTTKIISRIG